MIKNQTLLLNHSFFAIEHFHGPQEFDVLTKCRNKTITKNNSKVIKSEGVMMFVEKVDSDTLERETVNHSFLDITALVPSPDWLIGLDSLDLCKDEKRVNHVRPGVSPMDAGTDNGLTFTSPNWATEPRGVVTVITNTDNLCPLKEQPHHHQQPLPHPNGHDEHEDSPQFNIVSNDYHDQRMDTDGAGVLGDSLRVSGLDPPDDDDASRVDGLNSDALKQITNKGVHHNNKMDEPKHENSTEHSDDQNLNAELCLPTWTHPTKPTSYQHGHFLNGQQDKRCHTDLLSWRRIHSLSYITPEYGALNYLTTRKTTPSPSR